MIRTKRAYDPPHPSDGLRYLVDRLWPRGLEKDAARLTGRLRDAAPSDALRRWFAHDPQRWNEFCRRYFAELDERPDAWQPILDAARKKTLTLVHGARDEEHNNARALTSSLEEKLASVCRARGPQRRRNLRSAS